MLKVVICIKLSIAIQKSESFQYCCSIDKAASGKIREKNFEVDLGIRAKHKDL